MHIDIHIPRPGTTLLALAAVSGWGMLFLGSGDATTAALTQQAQSSVSAVQTIQVPVMQNMQAALMGNPYAYQYAMGGLPTSLPIQEIDHAEEVSSSSSSRAPTDPVLAAKISAAESRALEARAAQLLLREREEVIRYQLDVLKNERAKLGETVDEALEEEFRRSTRLLLALLQDQKKAEQFLLTSLHQIWEADGRGSALGKETLSEGLEIVLTWPVDPLEGISAGFLDEGYEKRFKFRHYGVDIPVMQGSAVHAAASGVVKDVVDHGLGFSYITIEHPGGYATLYGHLSKLSVQPGQFVAAGDAIGLSGGMPGTSGAGFSTGPHVHFGLYVGGRAVDPSSYLPSLN